MNEDPGQLIRLAVAGDTQAFGELYGSVYRELYRAALYTLGSREDAEDAVQETAAEAFRGIRALREPSAFRAWIFAILARRCHKKIKTAVRTRQTGGPSFEELEELGAEPAAPAGREAGAEDRVLLRGALQSLRPEERLVVLLSVVGNYSSAELAALLRRPGGTVRSQLHRGLLKLRALLEEAT